MLKPLSILNIFSSWNGPTHKICILMQYRINMCCLHALFVNPKKSLGASCLCCQIWLEDQPLSSYLHIKPNLTLTLVNGGCYSYTPCLVELHNLLTISRYHEWQEKLASKRQVGRGGAWHPVRYLVFHPGLHNIAHICMARWRRWESGVWLLRFIITVCSAGMPTQWRQ